MMISQLQRIISNAQTFTDPCQCLRSLKYKQDKNICVVMSNTVSREVQFRILNMSQIRTSFCIGEVNSDRKRDEENWARIKDIYGQLRGICEAIERYTEQSFTIAYIAAQEAPLTNDLHQLNPSFMYTQIFKNLFRHISFNDQDIRTFIEYCREVFETNDDYLNQCKQFEQNYHNHTPIWWYKNCRFLSSLLKTAIEKINSNLLIKLGFFIRDLCREIKELHTTQLLRRRQLQTFTVYVHERLTEQEFYHLVSMDKGLCSFNNFLLASRNKTIIDDVNERSSHDQDSIHVLYELTIDPSIENVYFAWISEVNSCQEFDDELLFSMHSVFRVGDIKHIDDHHRCYQVELILTTDTNHNLYALTRRIEEEIEATAPWDRLARLLLQLEKYSDAEQIYDRLISQTRDNQERAMLFEQLGMAKEGQRQYQQALDCYHKSSSSSQLDLARSYSHTGSVYYKCKRYSDALSAYEKALAIWQQNPPASELNLADSYNVMGLIYIEMGRHPEAFSPLENAWIIRQKILLPCHPALAESCGSLGKYYEKTDQHAIAYSYYEQAVQIGQRSLPTDHTKLRYWQKKLESLREYC